MVTVSADASASASGTRVNLQRKITLETVSKSQEVILNIEGGVERFELNINSVVNTGDLKIELYDPRGKNQGVFALGTQLDAGNSERVDGNIQKSLKDPQSGAWRVKILPSEATGTVTIQTATFY